MKDGLMLQKVESSNIAAVGYDDESEILYVEFKSGFTYKYFNVPYYVYTELMDADSCGKYLNQYVKGTYEYEQL